MYELPTKKDLRQARLPSNDRSVLDLNNKLLRLARDTPSAEFPQRLTETICSSLGLQAATFFVATQRTRGFRLKAAHGFRYSVYRDFQLPPRSYIGLAANAAVGVATDEAPFEPSLFHDLGLLRGTSITWLAAVAVPGSPESETPDPVGVVCIYGDKDSDRHHAAALVHQVAPLIGNLFVSSTRRRLAEIRTEVVESVAFDRELKGMVKHALGILSREVQIDAMTFWLLNPRRRHLYMQATTAALRDPQRPESTYTFDYQHRSTSNPLNLAFTNQTIVTHTSRRPTMEPSRLIEKLEGGLVNGAIVPAVPPKPVVLANQPHATLGLLIALNNYTELGDTRHFTDFTWEDIGLLSFGTEVLSVLTYQTLRNSDHEANFERRIHGIKSVLTSAINNIHAVEKNGHTRGLESGLQHFLPNTIQRLTELQLQIGRHERIARAEREQENDGRSWRRPQEFRLYPDLMAESFALLQSMARASGVELVVQGRQLLAKSHDTIPLLYGNVPGLRSVIRNLFENTIKYRRREADVERVTVQFSTSRHRSQRGNIFWQLTYEDDGIGIPEELHQAVFRDGFRALEARRAFREGQGLGLRECHLVMVSFGGTIHAEPPEELSGARFVLRIPTAASQR